jgi:translation initiation factor IF-3
VVPTAQALEQAKAANLDLVEVAPDDRPPVCRILDHSKMRFDNSHKNKKSAKTRQQKIKEIRVRPKTDDHDLDTKSNQALKFLSHNDKVQVTVLFRGREMQHQEEGRRVMATVLEKLSALGKIERAPSLEGRRMTALVIPIAKASKKSGKAAKPAEETS